MFNFNIDSAVECIKSIIGITQCVTCDKLIGPCVRFPCGHSICKDCAERIGECLFCISSPASYVIDIPKTTQLNNAAALLTAFQDTFNIDVFKRQRVSDHLRVEKQVFPECIQAPQKYCNKNKSLNDSFKNKENISPKFFSGEEFNSSNIVKMKKSAQYVQNWLNQNENVPHNLPRRPFGDINVNTQSLVSKSKQDLRKLKNVTATPMARKSTHRVRSHLKTIHKSPSLSKGVQKTYLGIKNQHKELETKKQTPNHVDNQINRKCDNNESGIVLEDDPIVIEEDTDINIIEKDRQAWLAVLEAAKKDECEDQEMSKNSIHCERDSIFNVNKVAGSTTIENKNNPEKIESKFSNKVLFLKRSSLFEACKLCRNCPKTEINSSAGFKNSNNVSIVINDSSYVTTIQFTNGDVKKPIFDKTSIAIQTDEDILLENEINKVDEKIAPQKRVKISDIEVVPKKMQKPNEIPESLDVFVAEKDSELASDDSLRRRKCLVIEDSDTDSNLSCNNTHEVVVDVHRPNVPESVECGILRTLSKMEYEHKPKRQARGHTPNSSNSSDKENFDPNRRKKVKSGKKHKSKK